MRTIIPFVFCVIFLLSLGGCAAIGIRAGGPQNEEPFAGVKEDMRAMHEIIYAPKEPMQWPGLPLVMGLIIADVPCSMAFDSMLLPADLLKRQADRRPAPTVTVEAPASAKPVPASDPTGAQDFWEGRQ